MTLTPEDIAAGWVEWGGGECPVTKGGRIELMWRRGLKHTPFSDGTCLRWKHAGKPGDIIAYRIIQPAAENGRRV